MNVRFVGDGIELLSMKGMPKINIALCGIQTCVIAYVCNNFSETCILGLDFFTRILVCQKDFNRREGDSAFIKVPR